MANREREIQLKFRVTPEERELIEAKMAQLGTQNMAAYLRKMALDGYVVRLELPELREMVSLLRRSSNNLASGWRMTSQAFFVASCGFPWGVVHHRPYFNSPVNP